MRFLDADPIFNALYYFKYKSKNFFYILLKTLLILLTIIPVLIMDLVLLVLTPLEFLNRTIILMISAVTGVGYVLYFGLLFDLFILELIQSTFIQLGSACDVEQWYYSYFWEWKVTILEYGCDFFDFDL